MNEYEPFFRDGVTDEALQKACNHAMIKVRKTIDDRIRVYNFFFMLDKYGYILYEQ